MKRILGKRSLALVSLLIALAVLEFAMRSLVSVQRGAARPIYVPHPHLVYTGNPAGAHNEDGFLGTRRVLAKPANTIRVACVGGSTTYGRTNWPNHLRKLLNDDSDADLLDYQVFNFGMAGYTSLESLINLAINLSMCGS